MGAFDISYNDIAGAPLGDGNYGGAIGRVIRGAAGGIAGIGDDVMRSAAKVLGPAANALKTLVTGDGTQAASALNSPHASASVSGSGFNAVSYSYSNGTVSAAPTKTGI